MTVLLQRHTLRQSRHISELFGGIHPPSESPVGPCKEPRKVPQHTQWMNAVDINYKKNKQSNHPPTNLFPNICIVSFTVIL